MSARRVLHVGLESPTTRRGGLNVYLDRLVHAQRDAGGEADVVWITDDPTDEGIAVASGLSWPRRSRAFARAIRRSRADVIDVHFAAHAWWAVASGACRGRPLVVHFQGPWALESRVGGDAGVRVWVKGRVEGYVLRRADLVVVLSNAFRTVAVQRYRVAPHRVVVVAPGILVPPARDRSSTRAALGLAETEQVWLSARRLVARMGLDVGLRAFARGGTVQRRYVIVGEGPERSRLENLARELGVHDAVHFTGALDDDELDQWYTAADVTIVPSVAHEGYGLVVGESLARGTPVVASDRDGLRDAARISRAVTLVEPTPEGIATAVDAVLRQPSARAAARADASSRNWAAVVARHEVLYDEVTSGPPARGVVILDHTARLSGGELAITRLVDAFDDRWRAHVILAEHGPLEEELFRRDLSFEVLPLAPRTRDLARDDLGRNGRLRAITDTARYAIRLRRVLRARRPAVVHTNSLKAHLYGVAASFGARWRTVMHVRDRWAPPYVDAALARDLRLIARWGPSAVLANSSDTASVTGVAATVLASPVEPAFFALAPPEDSPTLRLAVVGRLAPWKGQDLAILALAALAPTRAVSLTLVGDALFGEDEYAARLRELVAAHQLESRVRFTGHVTDVGAVLGDVDVVVLTSRSPEPFGNVVVEAMAAGRVVVVPNRGGVTEFVTEDGPRGSGFFYEMGDVDDLVEVLRRVGSDATLRASVGAHAREVARRFGADPLAQALEAFYDDLV